MAAGDELRAAAETIVGGALRAVATYDERDYELQYLRDDVARRYSVAEFDAVFEELALSGRDRDYLEGIFHAGHIECSILGFEDAMMFHFATDDGSGRFVTVDRGVAFDLEEFMRRAGRPSAEAARRAARNESGWPPLATVLGQ